MKTISKLSRTSIKLRVSIAPLIVEHHCKKCKAVAVSYYVQPMWTYPNLSTKPLELYWYCSKHQAEVFASMPKHLQASTKLAFTNSGRHETFPEFKNELILNRKKDTAIGRLAEKLLKDKNWPAEDDNRLLEIAQKEAGSVYLIYDSNGNFKRKAKKHEDAKYDPSKEVLVYCGTECHSSLDFIKLFAGRKKQWRLA